MNGSTHVLENYRSEFAMQQMLATLILAMCAVAELPQGQDVYAQNCAECHQLDGNGVGFEIPALPGSRRLEGPLPDLIRWIMLGTAARRGLVTDFTIEMPRFETLTDEEITRLTIYVLREFADREVEIAPSDVAAVRRLIESE